MMNTPPYTTDIGKLIKTWLDMAKIFWPNSETGSEEKPEGEGLEFNFGTADDGEAGDDRYKTYKTWEGSVNNLASILKIMTAPENQEHFAGSVTALADALTQAIGDSLENFTEFQSQVVKSLAKVGEHTKAYNFDDLNHDAFESFRELYRSELQKYLQMPKIGLPREFQERLSRLTDKSNIFSSYLIELIYLFSLPFEKTNRVMQKKIKHLLDVGEYAESSKQIYNDWIKALEGNYMELLRSKEYTDVLNETITSLADYRSVKTDVTDVFLKEMRIPTSREMDDVYKELYQMKKKIKELTRKVERLENELKNASRVNLKKYQGKEKIHESTKDSR